MDQGVKMTFLLTKAMKSLLEDELACRFTQVQAASGDFVFVTVGGDALPKFINKRLKEGGFAQQRCKKCPACMAVEAAKSQTLSRIHPYSDPPEHATDGLVLIWNRTLEENPCRYFAPDKG